jgi:hypothetical protein
MAGRQLGRIRVGRDTAGDGVLFELLVDGVALTLTLVEAKDWIRDQPRQSTDDQIASGLAQLLADRAGLDVQMRAHVFSRNPLEVALHIAPPGAVIRPDWWVL